MTDVVGSLMLVGITVVTTVGFAFAVFSLEGPDDELHVDLRIGVEPGSGGWSTGDERVRIQHLGGEALPRTGATITITVAGTATTVTGAGLGSSFADGQLAIGETWRGPAMNLAATTPVEVSVVSSYSGASSRIGGGTVSGAASGAGILCPLDTTAPTAAITQTPTDATAATIGPIAIIALVTDGCAGHDTAVAPRIHFRITPATTFTDGGPLVDLGGGEWSGSIAPPGGLWSLHAGKTLEYYVGPLRDNKGNTGQSATRSDILQLVYTHTYVGPFTATTGTVSGAPAARSATDGDGEAALAEAGNILTPGTGTGSFSGTATAHSGAVNPTEALTSNDVRAILDTTGEFVEVTGFTLPPTATGVTSVTIGVEARTPSIGGQAPSGTLSYRISGSTGPTTRTGSFSGIIDTTMTQDITSDRAWTVSAVNSMTVRMAAASIGNRDLEVDHIFVTVAYTTGGTTYSMTVQADWSSVPSGTIQQVQGRYRTSGDAFTMQVWNGATWRSCGGSLASLSLATFTCDLALPAEYNGGAPSVRFVDQTPAGTAQGTLWLEYLRVGTV